MSGATWLVHCLAARMVKYRGGKEEAMTEAQMEKAIEETASALAVEGLVMTPEERKNLQKVSRKELTYSDLIELYTTRARQLGAAYGR